MMETALTIYCIAAAAALVPLAGRIAATYGRIRWIRRHAATLRGQILRALVTGQTDETADTVRLPRLHGRRERQLLAETLAGAVRSICGIDRPTLRRIVRQTGIDRWLLRRIRRSSGSCRARYLSLLAPLPVDKEVAAAIRTYRRDHDLGIRFQVLLFRLENDPSVLPQLVAQYASPLSPGQIALLMSVLRRRTPTIDWEALLESSDRNLQRLGLTVARQFGIEESEERLLEIAARDAEAGDEALRTLCALRLPVDRPEIGRRLAATAPARRQGLLRLMARMEYAPSALPPLFASNDRPYYESLIRSRKCCLT